MIIVNMDSTCVRSKSIYQYDYGAVLRLQGAKLPTAVEIQFSFEERGGQSKSRIGITKDGVTDVVIPDTFVENDFTSNDYKIYVFIYLTDENCCRTEYKITIPVKSRPRLEAFDKPEDTELFHEAINEVNKSATSAEETDIEDTEKSSDDQEEADDSEQEEKLDNTEIDDEKIDTCDHEWSDGSYAYDQEKGYVFTQDCKKCHLVKDTSISEEEYEEATKDQEPREEDCTYEDNGNAEEVE